MGFQTTSMWQSQEIKVIPVSLSSVYLISSLSIFSWFAFCSEFFTIFSAFYTKNKSFFSKSCQDGNTMEKFTWSLLFRFFQNGCLSLVWNEWIRSSASLFRMLLAKQKMLLGSTCLPAKKSQWMCELQDRKQGMLFLLLLHAEFLCVCCHFWALDKMVPPQGEASWGNTCDRAFSVVMLRLWNTIPLQIRPTLIRKE